MDEKSSSLRPCPVSTDEQKKHGLSVDNQIEALKQYCKDNGYMEVGVYNDAGISARKKYTKRPALLALIADIQAGKVDIVLFTRLDRFFRSVGDYYACIEQMNDTPWRAIWEDYETETANGVLKVNIMLSVAQSEADRTSEKIKSVMQYKKERGDYVGKAPMGYVKKGCHVYKDKSVEPQMNAFFETYLKTFSKSKACKATNGLIVWEHTARNLLTNPAYMGESRANYKLEPYITPEQFQTIQEHLAKTHKRSDAVYYKYKFSGLLFCEVCDKRLRSTMTKTFRNYKCASFNHPGLSVSEMKVEKYLLNNLDEQFNAHIENVKTENQTSDAMIAKKEKAKLESKLQRVTLLFEEGDITIEEYRTKRDELKKQIAAIVIYDNKKEILPLPEDWKAIYNDLDNEHKHMFWSNIIEKIIIHKDKENQIEVIYK